MTTNRSARITTSALLSLLWLAGLMLMAGCSQHKAAAPAAAGWVAGQNIRVGLATNYPPLAFAEDGEVKGIEVDFAEELARDRKIPVSVMPMEWESLLPALLSGKIDVIMSGMSITRARESFVRFTDSYLRVGQMALIRADDISRFASPATLLTGAWRVGFVENTTGAEFARERLTRSDLVGFRSIDDGVAALHANKIDYFIHDAPTIWRLTTDPEHQDNELLGTFQPLTEEHLAWAVRPGDEALYQLLNSTLAEWQESGKLQEIIRRWIKVRVELRPARYN